MNSSARLAVPIVAVAMLVGAIGLVRAGPSQVAHVVTTRGSSVTVEGPEGTSRLDADQAVHAAVLAPGGERAALATGAPIEADMGGVVGNVSVVDVDSGEVLARTDFDGAVVTGLTHSPRASHVGFVKDYDELWLLDVESSRLVRLMSVGLHGSVLFDPAFSSDGRSIYVGVVEQTFHGEDDKLDNLWRVSLAGTAERVTDLALEGAPWKIVRGPTPLPDGRVLVTIGTPGEHWTAATITPEGHVSEIGPVPPLTSPLAAGRDRIVFKRFDWSTASFDVYEMRIDTDNPTWGRWCEASCEVLEEDVEGSAALLPGAPTASSSR